MLEPTAVARPFAGVPVWAVALGLAAVAPWCVRLVVSELERRARERTREALARAGPPKPEHGVGEEG